MVTTLTSKPKFDPKDMSVKETEHVQNEFGIEPEVFCQVKEYVWEGLVSKAKEDGGARAREDAKKQAKEELRQELTDQLMPELMAQAEEKAVKKAIEKAKKDLEPQLRTEIIEQLKRDWQKESLTEADREAFSTALRDVEVESLVFATSASKEADDRGRNVNWSQRVRHGLLAAVLVGLGPYGFWVYHRWSPVSVAFWLVALPYLVASVYSAVLALNPPERTDDDDQVPVTKLRRYSSEYLQIVSKARLIRHLSLNTKIRRDVQAEFDALLHTKAQLDSDYRPSVEVVEKIKPDVRHRLSEDIDPERILAEEFEGQLKEKQGK